MSYSRPPRLAYVGSDSIDSDEQSVYLMPLPDGPPVILQGSAAVIWLAAARGAPDVHDAVADQLGLEAAEIAGDVGAYLEVLLDQSLLEEGST